MCSQSTKSSSNVDHLSFNLIFIWQIYLLCFVWNTAKTIFIYEDFGISSISASMYFLPRILSQRAGIILWLFMHCNIALQNSCTHLLFHLSIWSHLKTQTYTFWIVIFTFWFFLNILVDIKCRKVDFLIDCHFKYF